jgi:hypothetical protein
VFDLHVCLWLSLASLLRLSGQFEKAKEALAEAEKVAEVWSRVDKIVWETESQIFASEETKVSEKLGAMSIKSVATARTDRSRWGFSKKSSDISAGRDKEVGSYGTASRGIRKVLADLHFEVFILHHTSIVE